MAELYYHALYTTVQLGVCVRSCLTLCNPMDWGPPGCSAHGVLQAWILERVAIASSRGPSRPRDRTRVSRISCIDWCILHHWHSRL